MAVQGWLDNENLEMSQTNERVVRSNSPRGVANERKSNPLLFSHEKQWASKREIERRNFRVCESISLPPSFAAGWSGGAKRKERRQMWRKTVSISGGIKIRWGRGKERGTASGGK